MAPFYVVLRAPSFKTMQEAEAWGQAEYPDHYIRMLSALDDAEWQREQQARRRNRRIFGGEGMPGEDPEC
jgi:hypothetical protein